ncbi:hypothetical protein L596_000351 [Steinernema carpocapsae]|uniref:Uncharacterized protein n=1 Tax=Steinernema carpocapsae TaxID=34508 RepID=A0A4V6I6X4_STECR|nr:hypothetical protein L596_000351 [Steinernema carpocapsae]
MSHHSMNPSAGYGSHDHFAGLDPSKWRFWTEIRVALNPPEIPSDRSSPRLQCEYRAECRWSGIRAEKVTSWRRCGRMSET